MTTTLRVLIEQPTPLSDADSTQAARDVALALAATTPRGCEVRAIAPSDADADLAGAMPSLAGVDRLAMPGAAVATLWRLGARGGAGEGLIHSPSLAAPLVRHDRVHEHDQTVVTLWDLRPWETPDELPRAAVAWARAMLKRAVRHADAVVVPTHSLARRLSEIAPLGDRVRVVSGAPASSFRVPSDEIGRRRDLTLPEGYLLASGSSAPSANLRAAFEAIAATGRDTAVVVLDAPDGDEPAIVELASAAGLPERRLHIRGRLDAPDRAAVFAGAVAFIAAAEGGDYPWRVLDALRVGVPVVGADSETHREILLDGAVLTVPGDPAALAAGIDDTLSSTEAVERLSVLATDRGRAFTWAGAAERIWQLHAEL
ncbi:MULTISPECIES: glycosyltransferase [unclassified Microbacterium]|uniref:glycosyltransferase n=1 Tax=unclassified Microbacterium TaxID=2609290 RepID=UPI0038681983